MAETRTSETRISSRITANAPAAATSASERSNTAGTSSPSSAASSALAGDLFVVDETSDLPIWAQLRNRFTFLIRSGALKEGEQLPSVRSLAAQAHINYNTVARAYRDLELAGLAVSLRGRGMFVQAPTTAGDTTADVDAIFEDVVAQYRALGMTYDDIAGHLDDILLNLRLAADKSADTRRRFS